MTVMFWARLQPHIQPMQRRRQNKSPKQMTTTRKPINITIAPALATLSSATAWAITAAKKNKAVRNDISERESDFFDG